ncbi:hypothetical protein [Promicromonospora sukumoe]
MTDTIITYADPAHEWKQPAPITHVVAALTNAGKTIVDLPEVTRPEYYAAEVQIDGSGLNGARVVRDLDSDRVSFLGVPCPIRAEVVPVFAAALLAVHQDAVTADSGDQP